MEYQPDLKNITGAGGTIAAIAPGSIAEELGLLAGDAVLAVGERQLRDVIDYRFAVAEEQIEEGCDILCDVIKTLPRP